MTYIFLNKLPAFLNIDSEVEMKFNLSHLELFPSIEEVSFFIIIKQIFHPYNNLQRTRLELSKFHTQGMCITETDIWLG